MTNAQCRFTQKRHHFPKIAVTSSSIRNDSFRSNLLSFVWLRLLTVFERELDCEYEAEIESAVMLLQKTVFILKQILSAIE